MQARPHLVIFARFPQAGVGKRRLAGGVGETASIRFQRVRLRVLVARLAQDPRWRTWLAVTPDRSGPWPTGVEVIAQGRGDLGLRMSRVFKTLPRGRAIIVGADIPGITADEIARVFHRLKGNDAVFGPADDGGYWLVGLKRACHRSSTPGPLPGAKRPVTKTWPWTRWKVAVMRGTTATRPTVIVAGATSLVPG